MLNIILTALPTVIVALLVLALVLLIAVKMIKDKRLGKSACGGCTGCPRSSECHQQKNI